MVGFRLRARIPDPTERDMPALKLVIWWISTLLLAVSCATHAEERKKMVDAVRQGRYALAERQWRTVRSDSPDRDRVMDLMDRGVIDHLAGRFAESNRALDQAKLKIDEFYGTSVTEELAAIAWNDASVSFVGEEFERVMLNVLMAMNYLNLGRLEDAAVEARQVNHRLTVWVDHLKRNHVESRYVQDPFAQYLAGMILEAFGEEDDALISYIDAFDGFEALHPLTGVPPPDPLMGDLVRLARLIGHPDALNRFETRFSTKPGADPAAWTHAGRLVVLASVGEVAHKESEKWIIPDPQFDTLVIRYPVFRRGAALAHSAAVEVEGLGPSPVFLSHDLSTLAIATLDDKNAQVKGRAVGKALARYAAKKAAKIAAMESDNGIVKGIAIAANVALNVADIVEEADTRSWMTLPDRIWIVETAVPPGDRIVRVRFGGGIDEQVFPMTFAAGETSFLIVRARDAGLSADPYAQPYRKPGGVSVLAPNPPPSHGRPF